MKRLYVSICRKWGPEGLTLSAYAHKLAKAGRPFWRDRIDGAFLLFFSQHQHCQQQWQREKSFQPGD
jgi:hypothetical protein